MTSLPEDIWRVLIRIIPSSSGRPRYPDGQYMPISVIDANRQEGLHALLGPYNPIKIEQCLNPHSGKPFPDYYVLTFREFHSVRGSKGAWNAVELIDNPWISMLVMEEIDEDMSMKELLDEGDELEEDENKCRTAVASSKVPSIFEEWWAATDPHHWVEHQKRVRLHNDIDTKGPWLYKGEPGDAHYYTEITSFSYETPAVIKHNIRGRAEAQEELVEYIDWAATDDQGRIALKIQVSELLTPVRIAHPEGESSGSDSEDGEMKGDTPDTTPPSSPPIGPADVSSPIASLHKHADKMIQSESQAAPYPGRTDFRPYRKQRYLRYRR
jgi:hypothetical protein